MNIPRFSVPKNEPTHVYSSTYNPCNIIDVCRLKHLDFDIEPSTGYRRSKNGKHKSKNSELAEAVSEGYKYYEELHVALRRISSNSQGVGNIYYRDIGISANDIVNMIANLYKAGIVNRYTLYGSYITVQLNPIAKRFYDKEFTQLHVVNYLNRYKVPNEIFYDCVLTDSYNSNEHYSIDVIYRTGEKVTFVITALSQKVSLPAQIERITRLANRLKSLTVVISPSVKNSELFQQLIPHLNRGVSVNIIPFDQLNRM